MVWAWETKNEEISRDFIKQSKIWSLKGTCWLTRLFEPPDHEENDDSPLYALL